LVHSEGQGVFPYMGYVDMCGSKGYGFSAVSIINKVSLSDVLHSYVFNIIDKTIKKCPS